MKKRQYYKSLAIYENKVIDGRKICLNCEKDVKNRRIRYCSNDCSLDFLRKHSHQFMRDYLIKKASNICNMCNNTFSMNELRLDHIIPVSIDGDEFNENNLQILCTNCHNKKTKLDMGLISKKRKIEKTLIKNKSLAIFNDFQ